jgi:hypothetical protein
MLLGIRNLATSLYVGQLRGSCDRAAWSAILEFAVRASPVENGFGAVIEVAII